LNLPADDPARASAAAAPASALPEPAVRSEWHGRVAVLTLANPPVNGLGLEMRRALLEAVARTDADAAIDAIVLRGDGRMFCGGADIRQFGTPKASHAPLLREVNRTIEAATKPVVAAIHGHALGGGLELAMSAHWRIATARSRFALPEVRLGFVPGGGGTQRLPRLVGLEQATEMIASGESIDADAALAFGLIDRIESGDLLEAALHFAANAAGMALAARVTSSRRPTCRSGQEPACFFAAARWNVAVNDPNRKARLECIRCVEAAHELAFACGLDLERAAFEALVISEESVRARNAFFAARASAPPATPARSH
jgi:3-hydroxyacyl-CoA dehydrogenase